ncbi:MAG: metallopeptidase family protein [Clostridia bacterium]|nr:metallopeptidase family protein [Clostridia bacterium]
MKTYEQTERMLDKIVDDTPTELFYGLTGGVILSEKYKLHPNSTSRPLFIMGEYQRNTLGNCIVIYYGSFNIVHGYLSDDEYYEKLRHTFAHELRHHMEFRSGVKDLERFDDERFGRYVLGMDISEFHEPPIGQ